MNVFLQKNTATLPGSVLMESARLITLPDSGVNLAVDEYGCVFFTSKDICLGDFLYLDSIQSGAIIARSSKEGVNLIGGVFERILPLLLKNHWEPSEGVRIFTN